MNKMFHETPRIQHTPVFQGLAACSSFAGCSASADNRRLPRGRIRFSSPLLRLRRDGRGPLVIAGARRVVSFLYTRSLYFSSDTRLLLPATPVIVVSLLL